jgi:ABC-2 type transport system permease protein
MAAPNTEPMDTAHDRRPGVLSGSFFPTDGLPGWLKAVSSVFPMKQLNTGMIDVMVRGKGIDALFVPAVVLIGFTVVVGFVAARVFKWEDD